MMKLSNLNLDAPGAMFNIELLTLVAKFEGRLSKLVAIDGIEGALLIDAIFLDPIEKKMQNIALYFCLFLKFASYFTYYKSFTRVFQWL